MTAEIVELTTCDCSLCVKKNAVMAKVPEASLQIIEGVNMTVVDPQARVEWPGPRATTG